MRNKWWTLAVACVATFMLLLDFTVVNLALPDIERDIAADFTDLQWVVDAYAVSLAALILVAGSLADRVGRRRIFVSGLVVFVAASTACGLAGSPALLNGSRALQGAGGAALLASALALIGVSFEGRERTTALAVWGAVSGTAIALGPLAGGAVIEVLSWRWIFFLNIPVGAAVAVIAAWGVPESRATRAGAIDWLGACVLATALGALVIALLRGNSDGWGSGPIVALVACAGVMLVAFTAIETRVSQPLLDLSLLRDPTTAAASIGAFGLGSTVFAMLLFLSLYIQNILGYGPMAAGLRLLPVTVAAFIAAAATVRLGPRLSSRYLLAAGLVLCGAGFVLMHGVEPDSDWTALLVGLVAGGLGIGLVNPTVTAIALGTVDIGRSGMASGLNNAFRLLGLATGVAALGAIFQHSIDVRLGELGARLPPNAAQAVSAGDIHAVVAATPPPMRGHVASVAADAFVGGLNEIFVVGAGATFVAALAVAVLLPRLGASISISPPARAPR